MARIFLSYDHDDAAQARPIATMLERAGHEVWYDRHIQGGSQFAKEIEQALANADSIVVLWSIQAIESPWVRDEAAVGRDTGRLVPLSLDGIEPPLGFRQYQTIPFGPGRLGRKSRRALLDAVERLAQSPERPRPTAPSGRRGLSRAVLAGIVGAIALILALLLMVVWRPWARPGEIMVSIAAARDDAASTTLSSDLARQLAALQTSTVLPVRLIEANDVSAKPSLIFETTASGPTAAGLALKSGRDSSILWSSNFEQPKGNRADLVQQLSFTAGRLIRCASEGLSARVPLTTSTLQLYLNACATMADLSAIDPNVPIGQLGIVVRQAPTFEPGWSALLQAEAELINPLQNDGREPPNARSLLKGHIGQARKINPAMPAIAIAEASLLPEQAFAKRVGLIERAVATHPDDASLSSALAGAMSAVGRQSDAVAAADKAVRLDPLSPVLHARYTSLLAYSGNFDGAQRELAEAEKRWQGTASLEDAKFRFHYRYGDPRIARAIFDRRTDSGGRAIRLLLDHRQQPSAAGLEAFLSYVRDRLRTMENPTAGIGFTLVAYAGFGRTEEAIATALQWPDTAALAMMSEVFFRPEWAQARRDPRFMRIAQRIGLVDYWRLSGNWPDFCFDADRAYDCKTEAAKLS
jgi:tetratricopeptide (TPR) repeat protein